LKKKVLFILKLLFGLGLLAYLIFVKSDPKEIIENLKKTIPLFAIVSFSLHAVGMFIRSIRWNILLKANNSNYRIMELMKFYLVSNFFNHFLPTRFGGDIIRVADTRKMKNGTAASILIVFTERISGIFVLFSFALIASFIKLNSIDGMLPVFIMAIAGTFGIISLFIILKFTPLNYFSRFHPKNDFLKKILNKINSLHSIVKDNIINKTIILKVLFWSTILQLNVIVHYYLIGLSLGLEIPFIDYFFIISILLIVLSIPISLNGYGVRETVLIKFFSPYGIEPATAIAFSFLDVIFNLILGVIGGIIYILRKKE